MAITKISAKAVERTAHGEVSLASGSSVALRMWDGEAPGGAKPTHRNAYETVGYAISGRAELTVAGETVALEPGDSWLVPADTEHSYTILEPFTAVEATSPPAGR